ncbi:MAG: helix-turn-helix domain-containing protein [Arenicellales bacterium]
MEFINPYSIPAIVALGLKLLLLWIVRIMPLRNSESKVFLAFLAVLSLHNFSEIMVFNYSGPQNGVIPLRSGFLYFTMGIIAMAILLHLMLIRLRNSTGWNVDVERWRWALYVPAAIVLVMLWMTDDMIKGFVRYEFSYTHVPGSLYIWFELYSLAYLFASLIILGLATWYSINRSQRRKNVITIVGIAPIIVMPIVVISLQSMGLNPFNLPMWFALALAFFLIVMAYAIYEYRLFDIFFNVPGTRLYSRRTRFHQGIKDFFAELDRLPSMSVEEALGKLAAALKCGVALVGTGTEPLEAAPLVGGDRLDFKRLGEQQLDKIDEIVLTKELKQQDPQTYDILKDANCAAVIPFRPFKETSAGWLLLGGRKGAPDELPIDFAVVESLFGRMGDLFLDNMVKEREHMNSLQEEVGHLVSANEALKAELERKQGAIDALYDQVTGESLGTSPTAAITLDELTSGLEKKVICDTLAQMKGNVSATAKALGLTRQTLYAKMESYDIDSKRWRKR